ncbi:BTAD domain-containing putative transcriptional regulator [Streptomyces sp. NPDC059176]|uniref:AfsR/SARP family transcriptional regulator n=1 Tax=unclassified Streptomyces TaxID=2593676 RepID=UPI0036AC47CC
MRFKVLGPLEASHDEQVCTPQAPKVRQVLALLLLRSNQLVSIDSLVEELWGETPPHSAVTTTQTYIYQLRKATARLMGDETGKKVIATNPLGYVFHVGDDQLDYHEFNTAMEEGAALMEQGQHLQASERLSAALALWRDQALTDVAHGPLLQRYVTHLNERYVSGLELRIQADMEVGRYRKLIPELSELVHAYPYNEWFHGQLMIALTQTGRRRDALHAYDHACRLLDQELGLAPSANLQIIHQSVLEADVRGLPPRTPRPHPSFAQVN